MSQAGCGHVFNAFCLDCYGKEVARQKEHNKLLTETIAGERALRKLAQATIEELARRIRATHRLILAGNLGEQQLMDALDPEGLVRAGIGI